LAAQEPKASPTSKAIEPPLITRTHRPIWLHSKDSLREFKPARNAGEISNQTAIALRIAKEVIHKGLTDGYCAVTDKSGISPDFSALPHTQRLDATRPFYAVSGTWTEKPHCHCDFGQASTGR
jgi:hypothetical protein